MEMFRVSSASNPVQWITKLARRRGTLSPHPQLIFEAGTSLRLKCTHITLLWCYSGKTDVGIESVAIGDFSAQAERCTVAETWILVWKMIFTALVPLIKVSLRHCLGTIRMAFKIYFFFPLDLKVGFTRNKRSIFSTDCISYRKITTIYYLYFRHWAQLSWGGSSLFHVTQAELPDIYMVSSLVVNNLATG